jgi:7,8-dihydropterin-6-yl-methyl-4-(beta-D-ribofuranosyl)aminobenzene 5'-phosphate synthase
VVRAGAKTISGETLLCGNLGYGLRLVSQSGDARHVLLFDTAPEGGIFLRNCSNLGISMGEIECIAVSHGHWDHMAALPAAIDTIVQEGGRLTVHVNPDMLNERGVQLKSGTIIPVARVPLPDELEAHGATVINSPEERLLLDGNFILQRRDPPSHFVRKRPRRPYVSDQPGRAVAAGSLSDGRAVARRPYA